MTGPACRRGSTRLAPALAPRSSPRWFRTCVDGSPGRTPSRAEPRCGSSHDFDRPKTPRTGCDYAGVCPAGAQLAGASGAGIAALEGASFILRQAAPHASILTRLDGPFQAGLNDLAATAYGLRIFNLEESGASVPDREEQLRIFFQTGSAVAPAHWHLLLASLPG